MDSIDPTLCALAKEFVHSGNVVWDVGANVGLFSFAAAHHAGPDGRVISFEPDVWLVQMLRRSSSVQPSSSAPVQIVPVAVAESCGLRTFNIAFRSRSANFLSGYGSSQTGGVEDQQTVVSASLDWLAERLPLPDVIKIDVEGAELEVLSGALGLLEKRHPTILCEVSSERSSGVTALLKAKGYRIYDGEVSSVRREVLQSAPWSTVAIAAQQGAPADVLENAAELGG
jgi:FkbM family methyltransferase